MNNHLFALYIFEYNSFVWDLLTLNNMALKTLNDLNTLIIALMRESQQYTTKSIYLIFGNKWGLIFLIDF